MLRRFAMIGFAGAVILVMTGHGIAADAATKTAAAVASEVIATAADAGKTIAVHVGQVLTIKLNGTRGSGKYWRLNADLTPTLTLSGRTTNGLDAPGAAEETAYSFKTNKPGTLVFKASYLAPGAPIPKTDDLMFTVNVQS